MNILFLNSLGKTKWGGGEKWMIKAGEELRKRGHCITIACLPGSVIEEKAAESELDIFHFNIPADIAFWKMPTLKKFLKTRQTDVLICCQNKDVKIGARAAGQAGVKAIFARQGIQNLRNKKKYIVPFTKYINGIITNTKSIKKIYESFGWFPENFIHVIYNGADSEIKTKWIDLHKRYGLPADAKLIFSAGRLDYQKGFDLLIDVAVKAKKRDLNWQFIVAGEGKLKDELKLSASKKGVSDCVRFIGFTNEVSSLMKASDVFILPSRYEGMPNALLEAMALGKACVATNVNGAPELAEDGISGFLTEPEDSDAMFDRLAELLSNEKLRKSVEANALKKVRKDFTFDKMADQLEQLFNKFII